MTNKSNKLVRKGFVMALLSTAMTLGASAQKTAAPGSRLDLAITYTADRTNPVNGANQWINGGSAELGADVFHGFGIAARVTGVTTGSIGSQNVPLNLVLATFGPRYRFHARRWSAYGEGLLGEANGFRGLFPASGYVDSSANSLVLQVGGGLDLRLSKHFGVRAVEANWTRTQFDNTTTNVQNHLLLGSGLVLRF